MTQSSEQRDGERIDHDQNLKNAILDYPHQAVALFAAREAERIDEGAKVTPLRQEMPKERLGYPFRELDIPLLVEWSNGEREALMFIIEPEAQARKFDIHRLAHYCLDLSKLYGLHRVVPVMVFLDRGPVCRRCAGKGGTRRSTPTPARSPVS